MKVTGLSEFFNTEYKQQAQNANFTKLAGLFGLKYTANKVAFTALKKNITNFQKVEVIANATALETLYMGGSTNIEGVIVNIAVDYVGSNNLSLFETKGDFGSRLNNTAAASRYIFAKRSKIFDELFNQDDLNILPRYNFEGEDIEYQFLTFNLPLLLINGAEGLGSGHAQKILPRSPEVCRDYIKEYLKTSKSIKLPVYYKGFKGKIHQGETEKQWITTGTIEKISNIKTKITEVPIGETYKSYIKKLDSLVEKGIIKDYDDLCNPKTDEFLFIIKHDLKFNRLSEQEKLEKLKLISKFSENYTIIDENNSVRVFDNITDLMNHYIKVRLEFLQKRKDYNIQKLKAQILLNENKIKFIELVQNNKIILSKKKKPEIQKQLESFNLIKIDNSYDYLLNMPLYSLTEEKMQQLKEQIPKLTSELKETEDTSTKQMWLKDLKRIKSF